MQQSTPRTHPRVNETRAFEHAGPPPPPPPQSMRFPIYQTSIAVNLAIALLGIFVVFNGPRVGC
jgi:hypothetical protein